MTPWLVLAAVVAAAAMLLLGFFLGRAQSSCALSAAATLSSALNQTATTMLASSELSPLVRECLSAISRSEQALAQLADQVEKMDETEMNLLQAFLQRGLVKMVDPLSGVQAGEPNPNGPRPAKMPRDSIPNAQA